MSNVSVQRCHGCTTSPRVFLVEVSSHCPLPQLCKKRSCSILPTSTAVACPRNLKHPILRMFEGNVASLMNVNLPETNASFREGSPVNFSNLTKKVLQLPNWCFAMSHCDDHCRSNICDSNRSLCLLGSACGQTDSPPFLRCTWQPPWKWKAKSFHVCVRYSLTVWADLNLMREYWSYIWAQDKISAMIIIDALISS